MTAATAVLGYTLRACLPLRRWWLLALPCVGAVLFGLLARVSDDPPERAFAQVASLGLFALLIPIACLVIGDAVLGAEIRASRPNSTAPTQGSARSHHRRSGRQARKV